MVDDFYFWSETWDRELDNIFEIQDEISLIIAGARGNENFTIETLAYESGFNSKIVFNTQAVP